MLTYVGEGYSPAFVAAFRDAMERLGAGEEIVVVDGPDDLCAPLLGDPDVHCHRASVSERDARARTSIRDHLGLSVLPGRRIGLDAATLSTLRTRFGTGDIRAACAGCAWSDLCSRVAETQYRDAVLR